MAKLGFLGLGLMGYKMARNLLRAGHDVGVWSHTEAKARKLAAEERGRFCATPAEAARDAECVFLCVGTTAMSRNAILGPEGVIQSAKPGCIVVDASTIGPSGIAGTESTPAERIGLLGSGLVEGLVEMNVTVAVPSSRKVR